MAKKTSKRSKKTSKREPAPPSRTSYSELFIRFWASLGLVVLILYAGLLAMSRTEGFRHLLAEHLETKLGIPVRIENSKFSWDLDLRLMNLEGAEDLGVEPSKRKLEPVGRLNAKSIYLEWGLIWEEFHPVVEVRYLEAEGVQVDLVENRAGAWQPAFLMPIAGLPDAIKVEHFQKSLGKFLDRFSVPWSGGEDKGTHMAIPFSLRDGEFRWINREGKYWAGGEHVSLQVAPLQVTGREMVHYTFSAGSVMLPGGRQLTDLSFEVMHSDEGLLVLEEGIASRRKSWVKRIFDGRESPAQELPVPVPSGQTNRPPDAAAHPAGPDSDRPGDPLQDSIRQALEEAMEN